MVADDRPLNRALDPEATVGLTRSPAPSSASANSFSIGTVIDGRFRITGAGVAGGMGVVYPVTHLELNEQQALKVLHPNLVADATAVERFREEARLARRLQHPGIVRVWDFGDWQGRKYLAMEWVGGGSLRQQLDQLQTEQGRRPRLLLREALEWIRQLAEALAYAHRERVLHRDLKPENVLLDGGRLKLTDFGIAKLLGVAELTATAARMGTAYYMAPEQLQGGVVDARVDLYSLGVVLYELLCGEVPSGYFPFPHEIDPSMPEGIDPLLKRCLARRPDQRFTSVEEFQAAIGQLERGLGEADAKRQAAAEAERRRVQEEAARKRREEEGARKTAQDAEHRRQEEERAATERKQREADARLKAEEQRRQEEESARRREAAEKEQAKAHEAQRQVNELVERAQRLTASAEFVGARAALKAAAEILPKSAEVSGATTELSVRQVGYENHLARAKAAAKDRDLERGMNEVRAALARCPDSAEGKIVLQDLDQRRESAQAHLASARSAVSKANFKTAGRELDEAEAIWPQTKELVEARNELGRGYEAYPGHLQRADAARTSGHFERALDEAQAAAKICPESPAATLARSLADTHDMAQEAADRAKEALLWGRANEAKGSVETARSLWPEISGLEDLERAISQKEEEYKAAPSSARRLFDQKKYREARGMIESARLTDPAVRELRDEIEAALRNQEARQEAIERFWRTARRVLVVAAVVAGLSVSGVLLYRGTNSWMIGARPEEAARPADPPRFLSTLRPLGLADFQTFVYKHSVEAAVRVQGDGYSSADGMYGVHLNRDRIVFGDLNGDGIADAVVLLQINHGGGNHSNPTLVAYVASPGGPKQVAEVSYGDRTGVVRVGIEGGILAVDVLGHGPNDPMCCPTVPSTASFKLSGTKLISPQ